MSQLGIQNFPDTWFNTGSGVPTEAENAVALTHTDLQREARVQLLLAVTRWGPLQPHLKDM